MKKVHRLSLMPYFEKEKIIGCLDLKSDLSCGYQHTPRNVYWIENHEEILQFFRDIAFEERRV